MEGTSPFSQFDMTMGLGKDLIVSADFTPLADRERGREGRDAKAGACEPVYVPLFTVF